MGLIGVARAGAFFAKDPEDETRRIMAPHKSNLAEKPPSLLYRIVTAQFHNTARIEWAGVSEYDADGLAASAATPQEKSELDEAREFLRDELSNAPMWAKQVFKDAADAGVTRATLYRAKAALRIKSEKVGTEGWTWSLPPIPPQAPGTKDVQTDYDKGEHTHPVENVENLENLAHLQNGGFIGSEDSPYLSEDTQDTQRGQGEDVHEDLPPDEAVKGAVPSMDAALEAMRHGNGPRKVFENVLEGRQKLPDLARSVMHYYGAKRFDGWGAWLEPVAEAFDVLTAKDELGEGGTT